jgi:ABC-type phosphate transport system substrate-binding protein
MDAVKAILMGCGALALLSVVGCVGLTSAGYYALDQAIEEAEARNEASDAFKRASRTDGSHSSDPFSDYQSESYEEESGDYEEGGWGEEAR